MWTEQPELKFLQQHGLEHGGIALEPNLQCHFRGLKLVQREPKDPLDPLCWHLLFTLSLLWDPLVCASAVTGKCDKFSSPLRRGSYSVRIHTAHFNMSQTLSSKILIQRKYWNLRANTLPLLNLKWINSARKRQQLCVSFVPPRNYMESAQNDEFLRKESVKARKS